MEYILITGVSTGIGYSAAKNLIDAGYGVFGSVRKQEDADRLVSDFGDKFIPLIFDVTDEEAMKAPFYRFNKNSKEYIDQANKFIEELKNSQNRYEEL